MVKFLILGVAYLAFPAIVAAGICKDNQTLLELDEKDRVSSDYFDSYYISSKKRAYYIYASKRVPLKLPTLTRVMEDYTAYPEFMPGYRAITMERNTDGNLLTGIEFRAKFSPFTSRFTTEVESSREALEYKQCWLQLKSDDARVIEAFENAPRVNRGFWQLIDRGDGHIEMNYFSVIRPPVPIPGWLYKIIVKGSYLEVFDAIIKQANSGSSD